MTTDKYKSKGIDINQVCDMLQSGMKNKAIAELLGCNTSRISQIKARYYTDKTIDDIEILSENEVIDKLSKIQAKILNLFNHNKLSALTANSLADLYIKFANHQRLLENKSTENIAINNIHRLDEKQLSLIQNAVKNITVKAMENSRSKAIKLLSEK